MSNITITPPMPKEWKQERKCGDCKFWQALNITFTEGKWERSNTGGCHRHPPRTHHVGANASGEAMIINTWPEVPMTHWCGEFES